MNLSKLFALCLTIALGLAFLGCATNAPKQPVRTADVRESKLANEALLYALYIADTYPHLLMQKVDDGYTFSTPDPDQTGEQAYHPCREIPTTSPPELPDHLAALATQEAARFTAAWEVEAAFAAAGDDRAKSWRAALALELFAEQKPAINSALILMSEIGWLTPAQCTELLPYLRKARGYRLELDRQRRQAGQDFSWINTAHWAHTCWAIRGCERILEQSTAYQDVLRRPEIRRSK